ncbi:MAG: CpsB/CapC family capsule biosynthesis tyrosine phosphatase [Aminipila sp.]
MRNANAAASALCDIHHHLIWGIDQDGPKTMEDSKAMALAAVRDGITHVVTTPHVMPGITPFNLALYREHLAALQSWCRDQGQGLRLYPGAEIFYTPMTVQYLGEGRVPTMNGTAHVLVEFDPGERYEQIRKACGELTAHGYIPILAHTERYTALVKHPKAALALREELGLAYQVNCSTIIVPKGFWQQRFIKSLLKEDAMDHIATDAHNVTTRPVRMREAIAALARKGADANTILQHSAELLRTTV